jgi:hypothetical protein
LALVNTKEHAKDISGETSTEFGFFQTRSLPSPGNRATGLEGETQYVGEETSIRFKAALASLFGTLGVSALNIYEALEGGVASTPKGEQVQAAVDVAKLSVKKAAPYLSILGGGNVLAKRADSHVVAALLAGRNALVRAQKRSKLLKSKATKSAEGRPFLGASLDAPTDPVIQELGPRAEGYLLKISFHKEKVSELRKNINQVATALKLLRPYPPANEEGISVGYQGEWSGKQIPAGPITVEQRTAIINDMNEEIDRTNIEALTILEGLEKEFFDYYADVSGDERYRGKTFAGTKERTAPFTLPNSASPAPQTSLQTSQ